MERRRQQARGPADPPSHGTAARTVLGGRYRLLSEIGRGGMGVVYRAEDRTLGNKTVAVKRLLPKHTGDPKSMARLRKEALVTLKLRHPNIVPLRQFDEIDGDAFLVMDYVDGESLDDRLRRGGPMGRREILRIFGPVAEALDFAHEKGVIHRDVKPGNILLDATGGPRLTDFGIARQLSTVALDGARRDGLGTLAYMSPEQLGGATPTRAQDVYGLAATMYHCVAGHPPFHEGHLVPQILTLQPEPPAPGDTPLARAILQGLSKAPEARPRSCRELVARAGALAERRRRGARGSASPRRRRRPAVTVVAAAIALVALAAGTLAWRARPGQPGVLATTPVADAATEPAAPPDVPPSGDVLRARIVSPAAWDRLESRFVTVVGHVEGRADAVLVNGNRAHVENGRFEAVVLARESGPFEIVVESETGERLADRRAVVSEGQSAPPSSEAERILAEAERTRRILEAEMRTLERLKEPATPLEGLRPPELPQPQKLVLPKIDPPQIQPAPLPTPEPLELLEPPKPIPVPAGRPGVSRWRDELLRRRAGAGNSGAPLGR